MTQETETQWKYLQYQYPDAMKFAKKHKLIVKNQSADDMNEIIGLVNKTPQAKREPTIKFDNRAEVFFMGILYTLKHTIKILKSLNLKF